MSAVLLLHAFPCDGEMWASQASALEAAGYAVHVPDLPGFAGTALPAGEPDLSDVARDLLARLDEPVDVVGLSLGGYLAMEMLRQQPAMVRSLCLVDTKAGADDPVARQRRLAMANAVLAEDSSESLIADLPALLLGRLALESRPDLVERIESWIRSAPAATIAWYQQAMARRPEAYEVLSAAEIPITVVWGDADVMSSREDQDRMLAAMPSARFHVIRGAGHLSAVESPQQVTEHLLDHLTHQQRSG